MRRCSSGLYIRRSRWLMLVASTWLMASAGLSYTFPVFSQAIKESLSYSQTQLEWLGTAADFGSNAGLLAAFLSFYLPDWLLLLLGSSLTSAGFLTLSLVSNGTLLLPFWIVLLANFTALNGTTFFSTVALVSSVQNFPRHRGLVIGLLSGFLGLSAALYTSLYSGLVPHSLFNFLLQLAIGPALIAIAVIPLYIKRPPSQLPELKSLTQPPSDSVESVAVQLNRLFFVMICMAVLLFSYTLALLLTNLNNFIGKTVAVVLVVLLIVPIFAPSSLYCSPSVEVEGDHKDSLPPVIPNASDPKIEIPAAANEEDDEITVIGVLGLLDFWVLLLSVLLAGGVVLTTFNNLGPLMEGLGSGGVYSAISFVSLWAFTGLVAATHFSEVYLVEHAVPRPLIMAAAQLLLVAGQLVLSQPSLPGIYVSSVFTGLGFGALLTLSPAIACDLFGVKSFAFTLNMIRTTMPLGSLLFSLAFSRLKFSLSDYLSHSLCLGGNCFGSVFILMGALCFLSALLSAWLASRTKTAYENISRKHPSRIDRNQWFQ